jgi:hypothetical protein
MVDVSEVLEIALTGPFLNRTPHRISPTVPPPTGERKNWVAFPSEGMKKSRFAAALSGHTVG